ncbi:hypothetical protein D3C81_765760 [compost metagenome]
MSYGRLPDAIGVHLSRKSNLRYNVWRLANPAEDHILKMGLELVDETFHRPARAEYTCSKRSPRMPLALLFFCFVNWT